MNMTRQTKRRLWLSVAALMTLSACKMTTSGFGTEAKEAMCRAQANGLILPSRADTLETARALNNQIADYKAICPEWAGLAP